MTDLDRLAQTLEQLRAAAAGGTLVDLGDLMPAIERAGTEARDANDCREAASGLQGLARSLDGLHGALARAEEATRRSAMESYAG
jgi:hypothetical protein